MRKGDIFSNLKLNQRDFLEFISLKYKIPGNQDLFSKLPPKIRLKKDKNEYKLIPFQLL